MLSHVAGPDRVLSLHSDDGAAEETGAWAWTFWGVEKAKERRSKITQASA